MDLFARTPPEQLCVAQTVVLSKVQSLTLDLSHMPVHLPEPRQALRGVEVKVQIPVTQDSQFPSHTLSQQCPSTHKPLLHSPSTVQGEPFGRVTRASGVPFEAGASAAEVVPPVALEPSELTLPLEPPDDAPLVDPPAPPAPPSLESLLSRISEPSPKPPPLPPRPVNDDRSALLASGDAGPGVQVPWFVPWFFVHW
jgi:hypothetical protein